MLKKQINAVVLASFVLVPLCGCAGSNEPVRPTDEVKDHFADKAAADRAAMEQAGADADLADPSN
jgi:hypothetical protein